MTIGTCCETMCPYVICPQLMKYLLYIPEKELFSRGRETEVGSGRRHVLLGETN